MDEKLNKKINFLTGYAIVSTVAFAFILFSSFNVKDKNLNVDELTLKRLNLIGEDGSLRVVISNETRQHPGRIDGKDLPKRERPAGIIFFNNEGDECGGIVFGLNKKEDVVHSGISFTMDNYRNDQVVQILNNETYKNDNAEIVRGLMFNEFQLGSSLTSAITKFDELNKITDPEKKKEKEKELESTESSRRRLFIGRNTNNDNGLFLYDSAGMLKMKIYVDKEGKPKIEVINKEGEGKNILIDSN